MILSIVGCARCYGEGHENLEFKEMVHSVKLDHEPPLTHWATCPTTGDPILLCVVDAESEGTA